MVSGLLVDLSLTPINNGNNIIIVFIIYIMYAVLT